MRPATCARSSLARLRRRPATPPRRRSRPSSSSKIRHSRREAETSDSYPAAKVATEGTWRDRLSTTLGRLWRSVGARLAELRSSELNLSWITPQLAAGGAFRPADIPRLRRLGITAV